MRKSDWEQRLADFIAKSRARPYEYGRHDCLLFIADAVRAITGKDHARGHRGKYKNETGALRRLKSLGHDRPEELLDKLFKEKPVGFAQRGDIVLASDGIPAVCMGAFAVSVGQEGYQEGLVRVPRSDWVKAWKIG